jgi:hypothetical protein
VSERESESARARERESASEREREIVLAVAHTTLLLDVPGTLREKTYQITEFTG